MYNIIREQYVSTKDIFGNNEWSMVSKSLYCDGFRTLKEAKADLWAAKKQIETVRKEFVHYDNKSFCFFDHNYTQDTDTKTVWYIEKV